jgi:hypothetical protein
MMLAILSPFQIGGSGPTGRRALSTSWRLFSRGGLRAIHRRRTEQNESRESANQKPRKEKRH